jgi:hypothetical protein
MCWALVVCSVLRKVVCPASCSPYNPLKVGGGGGRLIQGGRGGGLIRGKGVGEGGD